MGLHSVFNISVSTVALVNGITCSIAWRGSSVGCAPARYVDGRGFDPHVRQHSFVEICNEIIFMALLSLPLIQEGQLSVTGERICTKYW